MDKKQNATNNIKLINKNLEVLKKNFPQCFDKNGDFLIEKFQKELKSNEINFSKESYSIDWLGKSYARLLASDEATTLLKEDKAFNQKPENINSENLLIKGDNLEVLKHLAGAYYEKIKMIYIDPPYNTGKDDFVYSDERKFSVNQLRELAGIDEDKAKRILEFTQSNSNSHSAWLTFMYPRLYIAKRLLKDDGVIFISIDDNEVAQLKLIMDEIFGEENFVGQIVWQTATDNNPTQISTEHEYVISYVNNIYKQDFWEIPSNKGGIINQKYLELKEQLNDNIEEIQLQLRKWIRKQNNGDDLSGVSHYSYVDEFGVYYPGNSANTKPGGYTYDIIHPISNLVCSKPQNGYRFTYDTFIEADKRGDVQWGEDENTIPKIKKRLNSVTEKLKSYYYEDNRNTTAKLTKLFNGVKVFNNPKSINFLKHILVFITNNDDIILDFFAGSGTTGDAVMQLNKEDGGNRKFILVQLPEEIDEKKNKVAYDFVKNELGVEKPTIFEITKERLIRAANRLKKDEQDVGLGFKIFETMPIWEDYNFEANKFSNELVLFDDTKLSDNDIEALLTTWKTYDGMSLTDNLKEIDLGGYVSYYGNGKLYLMNKGFSTDNLKCMLEKIDSDKSFNPTSIIVFGYKFESKNLREIAENIKAYSNKKNIDIDFITRY